MKKIVKIAGAGAAIAAAGLGAASYGLLQYGFRRRPSTDISKMDETSEYYPFKEQIVKGIIWLDGMPHEEVSIESHDGLTLVGRVYDPGDAKGTLLGFHGYRSNYRNDFAGAARFYYEKGYRMVLVDQRAHSRSDGEYISMGVQEREDVVSWVKWIGETYGKTRPVFLTGVSMGASTVLMAADRKMEANVCGIIADCGFTSPWDMCGKCLKDWFHLPKFPILPVAERMGRRYLGCGLKDGDTRKALANSLYPVFLIHGKDDDFVPCYMTEQNYEACTSPKRVLYVEGAGHVQSWLMEPDRYKKMLSEFLEEFSKEIGKE